MAEKEYIEREKIYPIAKKVVDAISSGNYHPGVFAYDILDWIDDLPVADVVEVRHAKDVCEQYNEHHCEFMCSLCGKWIGVIEDGDCDFNYCPNCGADMMEADE